ncbi:uncharacterized protein LOC113852188 [Abrus precatorius]|uniref:Uncharacterized protein LOC113852188 n=1 Tax=Abrus precatorius TaxID=3816 RepID=A0A8B8K4H8_ABRPR|nr:uncharacterized protein LOC113852188 [Abrus precatorius]
MEEIEERAELQRMQREQERERRRIRDRQRRQSMTQEQRERHLARRRRNYQLRRQRAANSHAPFIPQLQALESSVGEASTSDEFHGVTASTSLVLSHAFAFPALNQAQQTHNFQTNVVEGASVELETLAYKPANSPRKLRLSRIRGLARNLTRSMVDPDGPHHVAAELITKEDASVTNFGSMQKSLRLNCVKRLARSKIC